MEKYGENWVEGEKSRKQSQVGWFCHSAASEILLLPGGASRGWCTCKTSWQYMWIFLVGLSYTMYVSYLEWNSLGQNSESVKKWYPIMYVYVHQMHYIQYMYTICVCIQNIYLYYNIYYSVFISVQLLIIETTSSNKTYLDVNFWAFTEASFCWWDVWTSWSSSL